MRPFLILLMLIAAWAQAASAQVGNLLPLVIIDAGHGGVDPGAIGPTGAMEKRINLEVALLLEQMLRESGRYEPRLTRRIDDLVPLQERTRIANAWKSESPEGRPAIFLSIHVNAHDRRTASGVETYFLSEALTEDARSVAARENEVRRFEEEEATDPLRFILTDLRQNLYLHESSDAAELFQRRLARVHPGPDRGVKQAGFVVLEGAFMPAVLVELGFITNPVEEQRLVTADFQRTVTNQLALAIDDFFTRSAIAAGARSR